MKPSQDSITPDAPENPQTAVGGRSAPACCASLILRDCADLPEYDGEILVAMWGAGEWEIVNVRENQNGPFTAEYKSTGEIADPDEWQWWADLSKLSLQNVKEWRDAALCAQPDQTRPTASPSPPCSISSFEAAVLEDEDGIYCIHPVSGERIRKKESNRQHTLTLRPLPSAKECAADHNPSAQYPNS